ncbi:aldolase [Mytilinidion resinicola]|uniref:deoxyribose-phosphate aldolase n=1 Tax=Mytilinidion resinicola TaxID=574789 RepID=A0A6A6Y4L1_9PEZI|nr:aldolase [Mytilinidion resinicola]KAF2802964.1 aldolase [Mytilinidion resinicola]
MVMTDRYTNAEWAVQIAETQKNVVAKLEPRAVPKLNSREFAQTIDHTLLKLDATATQIDALCSEARIEGFKSVCVRLPFVARCVSNLKGSPVVVACVVGFHEGTQDSHSKFREAQAAVTAGASELDIVLNHAILTSVSPPPGSHQSVPSDATTASITASNTASNSRPFSSKALAIEGPYSDLSSSAASSLLGSSAAPPTPNYSAIYTELASLRSLCPAPTTLKLILETAALTPSQILAAATLAAAANFDFIKTSTGFAGRGATLDDVVLMTAAANYLSTQQPSGGGSPVRRRRMQVKASGGVRSLEDAVRMLEAGATRLGTSSGLWIMQEARRVVKERELSPEEKARAERPGGGVTRLYTDNSVDGY